MDWSTFIGAFVGSILAILVTIAAFAIWDYFDRRKANKSSGIKEVKPPLKDILESHLEDYIVENFAQLFPGWKIYDASSKDAANDDNSKPTGIRFRTDAGEIDFLCLDDDENYVVIELKRDRASDRVVSQVDRYIAWVEKNLVKPNQRVRGIVVAKRFSNHLSYSLSRKDEIDLWIYDWQLTFNNRP